MKIAVTGGNGDLARVLIPMLVAHGHQVVSIDRTMPPRVAGNPLGSQALVVDVTDFGQVVAALAGCQGVIHLAAHRSPMNAPAPVVYNENSAGSYNVLLAAEMLGASAEAFERTVQYLKDRKQFGVPIGSFQALKHRAAELFAEIEVTRSAVLAALVALDPDGTVRIAAVLASLVRHPGQIPDLLRLAADAAIARRPLARAAGRLRDNG